MAREIRKTEIDRTVRRPARGAKRFERDDDGGCRRHVAAHRHDEIEKLLGAKIGGEAGFVDDVVGEMQTEPLRDDAARAVRDIRKRTAVDDGRRAFRGLHQVGHQGVVQQQHHRADGLEVGGGHRLPVIAESDDDTPEALAEIGAALGQREDGHDLGRRGDHESGLPRGAALASAEAGRDAPQRAIVHVHAARPENFLWIDPQVIAKVQVRVEQGREQVVRGRDGVEVAGEVQVDAIDRLERRLAAAGGAALHAEHRTERRLAQRRDGVVSELHQALSEANRVDGLSFTARGRRDGRDENELAAPPWKSLERFEANLRDRVSVGFKKIGSQSEAGSNVGNRQHKGRVILAARDRPIAATARSTALVDVATTRRGCGRAATPETRTIHSRRSRAHSRDRRDRET